ncbi:hypothetical protein [Streptomyces sp. SP17KL33]|uniref:hypothetical protein n=1 Tax=Streptomyces sp. SP17KL33 TaxID=3002534 RepID=UPI002E78DCAC|nr:hypothetical protein [Streptomyces sp. SP17KL33]MEE1835781.1 hypothetical protein [Streptomyces sp. SP17KL33]
MVRDWFSVANEHAAKMREFYEAFVRAGFTDGQAFLMVQNIQRQSLAHAAARGD